MVEQDAHLDFIGRGNEITLYLEWLQRTDGPWILYFRDAFFDQDKKGGIGKTWLLSKCAQLTQELYPDKVIVRVDFFNVADRNGIVIAERVIELLQKAHENWSPTASKPILAEYHNGGKDDGQTTDLQKRLANAIASDLSELDKQLQTGNRHLLIFYDTFELIEQDPMVALLNVAQKFPDNYQFKHIGVVMAGRNALNSYWYGRDSEVYEVALGPFSLEEMTDYINRRSSLPTQVADSSNMKALYERTEGRPILVGLVTDLINNQSLPLENLLNGSPADFEKDLVSRIMDFKKPINWVILFMAHAYHRFNTNVLYQILQDLYGITDINYQSLVQELPTLSFVRHTTTGGNDFILHDEMRRLVTRHCWEDQDPDRGTRIEISKRMIEYYEHELKQEKNKLMKQSYTVELVYHLLFSDLTNGLKVFEEEFRKALTLWSRPYARSLLREVQLFSLSREQYYRLVILEARLLLREENPRRALTLYQYLQEETEKDWLDKNRSRIYHGIAECFLNLGNLAAAMENAQKSFELEQHTANKQFQAELLAMLGYIHQHQGYLDEAVDYYERSLAIYKQIKDRREYADKINSLGHLYRIKGKIDEALRCCQVALQMREELFKDGEVGELQIGLSLNTLGVVYLDDKNFLHAEDCFQKAYEIFQRVEYKRGIARICNRLGLLQEMKGNLDKAMRCFQNAYNAAHDIESQEDQINSLNKKGRVFMSQKSLSNARKCFEQAIALAAHIQDTFQEVESLIDLAKAFEDSGIHGYSRLALELARSIALQHSYYYLLGTAEDFWGVLRFPHEDYDSAFKHFVQFCHYMALFNSSHYKEAIRSLIGRLIQVPRNFRPGIIAMIRAYWSNNGLNRQYPELMDALDDLEDLDF